MRGFWSALGTMMVSSFLIPLVIAQEEPSDMGRKRRKNKRALKKRGLLSQHIPGKTRKSDKKKKFKYAFRFYTDGVLNDITVSQPPQHDER